MAEPARAAQNPPGPPSIIGAQGRFHGLVQLREPARIDGEIEGEIFATDTVWIGESGRVRAKIEAPEVVVAGELDGSIVASRRVELTATARVIGTVETPLLTVAEGGVLEGRCAVGSDSTASD